MSDPSTSLMLLLRKAGRRIHSNSPLDAQVERWLAETVAELRLEQDRFPDEAIFPGWNLLAADGQWDQPAMFALAILHADGIELCAGRGAQEAVLAFGEDVVEPVGLIDAARARFEVAEGEFHLDAGETERLMD